jgi:GT2 family glycosyltransferase
MVKKSTTKHDTLIILPTLGQREEYLKETIASIRQQTYQDFDIAIIYPLKNRFVTAIADELGAIKVPDPGGLSAALNAGIAAAKPHHEFISWIGDDDLLTPESLERAVRALSDNPTSPVAYGYCDYIDQNGGFLFKSKAGSLAPWIMTWGPNLLPLPGALFRKDAILKVGGFDESNKHSMDLDIFLRLKKIGKFINTKHTLAAFRWHSDSMSVASRDIATKEAEAVKYKYTHPLLRPLTSLWFIPTRYASKLAAKKLSKQ